MVSDDDGETWTTKASAADNNWYSVTVTPTGRLVAVAGSGTGNRVMVSDDDGETWTTKASAADNNWISATVTPTGRLVAVAYSGTGNRVMVSGPETLNPGSLSVNGAAITPGSGTGLTVDDRAKVRKVTYKVTVTFQALSAAATTADKTIATLPAKTRVLAVYADTTTKYIGGGVTAASLILGTSVGGAELIATHDVFTASITRGLADADMGTLMTRAARIQGGAMPSFTGTTNVSARLTTTTANTDQLTQGSTTFYIETEILP
jgi:hypothetical protein